MSSTDSRRRWNMANRSNPVTHALSLALKMRVDDPYRLLAIAVVGLAVHDGQPIDQVWTDLADIDAQAMGVAVSA